MSIKVSVLEKKPYFISFDIEGKYINHSLVNSLRRSILGNIIGYSFDVNIEENTSVFFNPMIESRMADLPINQNKINLEKNNLRIYLNIHNETSEIIHVTTNDIEYYIDDKQIENIFDENDPIDIISLKQNQKLTLSGIAIKGYPNDHDRFSCVSNCTFKIHPSIDNGTIIDANKYNFYIEGNDILYCYQIIKYACNYLLNRLNIIYDKINDNSILITKNDKQENVYHFTIYGESHTIGTPIEVYLQNNQHIKFCGNKISHPLSSVLDKDEHVRNIHDDPSKFKYENSYFTILTSHKNPKIIILDTIDIIRKLITVISDTNFRSN